MSSTRERVRSRTLTLIYGILLGLCGWYYGVGLGTFNSFLESFCQKTMNDPSDVPTKPRVEKIGLYVSLCFFVGCTTAGALASKLIDTFGRFRVLIGNHIFCIIVTLPLYFIHKKMNLSTLYAVRYFQGIGAYLWTTVSPVLARETLPFSVGNVAKPVFNASIAGGILMGYAFGMDWFKARPLVVLFFPVFCEILKLIPFALYFRMESPKWMAAKGAKREEIVRNYEYMYRRSEAEEMADEIIKQEQSGETSSSASFFSLFSKEYILQFLLVLALNLLNQLTGMNIITVFSTSIMENSGVLHAEKYTTGLGFLGLLATTSLVYTINKFGIRNLMIAGLFGQALGLTLFLGGLAYICGPLVVAGLYLGMASYNISLGGLLFLYAPDLVPAQFLSYFSMAQWFLACTMVLFLDKIKAALSLEGMFFVAQICATLGGIFFLGYGIDTSGKNDEQIQQEFMRKKFFV